MNSTKTRIAIKEMINPKIDRIKDAHYYVMNIEQPLWERKKRKRQRK